MRAPEVLVGFMKDGAPVEDLVGRTNGGALAFPAAAVVPAVETPLALSTFARFRWSEAVAAAAAAGLLGPPEAAPASLLLPGTPAPAGGLTRPIFPGLPLLVLEPALAVPFCPVTIVLELPPPAGARAVPVAEEYREKTPAWPAGFRCAVALPPATPPPVGCFPELACAIPVDGLSLTAVFVAPALPFPLLPSGPLRALPVPSVPRGFRAAGGPIVFVAVAATAAALPASIERC